MIINALFPCQKYLAEVKTNNLNLKNTDDYAKSALHQSYQNCLTFPWINDKVIQKKLNIHLWFFDIKMGEIFTYSDSKEQFEHLS